MTTPCGKNGQQNCCEDGALCIPKSGGALPNCGGEVCLPMPKKEELVRMPGAINGRIYYVPSAQTVYAMPHASASQFCEYYGLHLASMQEACLKDYAWDSGWDCANISMYGGNTFQNCDEEGNCSTYSMGEWGNIGGNAFWLTDTHGDYALRVAYSCGNNHAAHRCSAIYPLCYSDENVSCPVGYYCPNGNLRQKTACSAGQYCPSNVTSPISCPAGYYCPDPKEMPKACPEGTYSNAGAKSETQCLICPIGWYCEGAHNFGKCPAGSYATGTGNTSCSQCVAGTYNPSASQGVCKSCNAGYYCPQGAQAQIPCPAGYYCPAGSKEPISCEAGYYCPAKAATHTACPAGTYRSEEKGVKVGDCSPCSAGYFTNQPGQSECTVCDDGKYSSAQAKTCSNCPAGFFCASGQ